MIPLTSLSMKHRSLSVSVFRLPCAAAERNHSLVQSCATYTTRLGGSTDAATAFLKQSEIDCRASC